MENPSSTRVYQKREEAFHLSCIRGTIKLGVENVSVWGCMAWHGVGKLNFIHEPMYVNLCID